MVTSVKYGQFIQIIPNTFGMGNNTQHPINGSAFVNLTLSSTMKNMFDLFVFNSPYNEFYVCYIHMLERSGQDCKQYVQNLCIPCPKDLDFRLTTFIQIIMSQQLNYSFVIEQAGSWNTLCYLGCESDNIGSFNISDSNYSFYQNAAAYIIIDNSPFPDLLDCNIQLDDCNDPTSTLDIADYVNREFCESIRQVSCVQKFQNLTKPEIVFQIDFSIKVTPDNYPYYVQYMVMIILLIIILFLFIILCVVAIRFKRVKKQKLLLMNKIK